MSIFDAIDRKILRSIKVEHIVKRDESKLTDSFEIGTPGRSGVIKVYGDFNDPEAFKVKVSNALLVQSWTLRQIQNDETNKK